MSLVTYFMWHSIPWLLLLSLTSGMMAGIFFIGLAVVGFRP